jgi:cobalamin biosynthesis protein CbiG
MRMPSDPKLRASDADRERTVALLSEHLAAGRLTAEEFQERLDAAYAARTLGQLDELLADLPAIDLYELPDATLRRNWPGYGQLPWTRRSS